MTSFLKGLLAVAAGAGEGAAIGRIDELKAKAEEEKMKRLAELNDLYAQKREGRAATREDIVRKDERGYKEGLLQEQRDYQTFTQSEKEKADRESATAKEEADIRKTESERRYKEETGGTAFQSFTDHIKIFEEAGFKNSKELAIKAFNAKTDAAKRKNYADFYTAYTKLQADSGLPPKKVHEDAVEWAGIAAGITPKAGPPQPITILTGDAAKKRAAELIADIRANRVNPAQLSARLKESKQFEVWSIIAEDSKSGAGKPTETETTTKSLLAPATEKVDKGPQESIIKGKLPEQTKERLGKIGGVVKKAWEFEGLAPREKSPILKPKDVPEKGPTSELKKEKNAVMVKNNPPVWVKEEGGKLYAKSQNAPKWIEIKPGDKYYGTFKRLKKQKLLEESM